MGITELSQWKTYNDDPTAIGPGVNRDFDAIAVGGGLAGSAFALTLARNGYRVAVVERTAKPQIKVCGDFLSVEAQQLLATLGVDVWSNGARRIHTLRMVTGAWAASAPLPFEAAGLSRLLLDELLLCAAEEAGATVFRGQRVHEIHPSGQEITVRTGATKIAAVAVALATGKHNIKQIKRRDGGPTGFKMSFELRSEARRSLEDTVQLVSYHGGYIGACNIENGAATLCWLADKSMMSRTSGRWDVQLDELRRQSPFISDLLDDATPLTERPATVSAIPFGYKRTRTIHTSVFPIGDQLAVIPSFTGDGTSLALMSGILAAEAVLQGQTAEQFQSSFHVRTRRQFRWASAVDVSFKTSLTRFMSIGAVAAFPILATSLARRTRFSELIT